MAPEGNGTRTLELITFPGPAMLPIHVAHERRLFRDPALVVNITPTPGSAYQIRNTVAGRFDIASTAIDNVVAYQEGQGVVELDREPDLFVFMGSRRHIVLDLVVQPDIAGFADLRGKTLAVDALSTGYAFVLRHMLERNGLPPGTYELEPVGGAVERLEAMTAKRFAGALLNPPYTKQAQDAGLRLLASGRDALESYQGNTFAASRTWAAGNRAALVSFIRGFLRALDWLKVPGNRDEAARILAANSKGMSPEAAARQLAGLLGPTGFADRAALDLDGVRTVLDLRSRYAEPRKVLTDPMKYIDLSYYQEALTSA